MPSRRRPTTSTSTNNRKAPRTKKSMGNATSSPSTTATPRKRVRYNRRASCAKELVLLIGEGGAQILTSQRRQNKNSSSNGGGAVAKEKVSTKPIKDRRTPPATTSSPRKTRAAAQKRSSNTDVEDLSDLKCELCGQSKPLNTLRNCPQCVSIFHLSCLHLEPALITFFSDNPQKWTCPRCVCCVKCEEYIHDPDNVQCIGCGRAWHGSCIRSGSGNSKGKGTHSSFTLDYPCINWRCDRCKKKSSSPIKGPSIPTVNIATPTKKIKREMQPIIDPEEQRLLEGLEQWRTRGFKDEIGVGIGIKEEMTTTSNGHSPQKRASILTPNTPKSSRKRKLKIEDPNTTQEQPTTQLDNSPTNRWIYLGPFIRFVPIYASSYSGPIKSADNVYVCEFCLKPLLDLCQFRNHVTHCPWKHPPGNEIYREPSHQTINIWEVEGNIETAYCRNLCLFAKLFLSSKTLHYEVETFTFYVLTEVTPRGCVFVGYFSKEKNPTKNNNLSCLLTLPSKQGKGYGKFLIDLSYSLSRRENKIGSPEHPLSDSGLMAYRSYWRSAIICWLRRRRYYQGTVSIKDVSIDTGIHSADIVSTLLEAEMLLIKSDCFYIDTDKAYNASVASLRRRTIKDELLVWQPPFEVDGTNKMNSYATD